MRQQKPVSYGWGCASFIPVLGVLFGLISIIQGLFRLSSGGWKMIVLGMSGIFFTIALYGSMYYWGFVAQEGAFVELNKQVVQRNLMATMNEVEVYKVQTGQYPDTIAYLLTKHEAKMQEMFEDRDKEPTYADMMELNITMNSQSEMEMKRSMYAQDPFYLNSLSFVLFSSSHEFSARLLQYKKSG